MDDKTTAPLNDDVLDRVSGGGSVTIEYTDQILGELITEPEFNSVRIQTGCCTGGAHKFRRECIYWYMPDGVYSGNYQKYVCLNCGKVAYVGTLLSI